MKRFALLAAMLALCPCAAVRAAVVEARASGPGAAPPIIAPLGPEALESVAPLMSFVEESGPFRVFFGDAYGLGHQAATLAAVRRLRELGYRGEIEGIYEYPGTLAAKLAVLIPEADAARTGTQRIPRLGMTLKSLDEFKRSRAPAVLALTGGADRIPFDGNAYNGNWADAFDADFFMRLGPMNWPEYPDEIHVRGRRDGIPLPTGGLPLVYRPASAGQGVEALAGPAGEHELLPAYGFTYFQEDAVHRLLLGAAQAVDERPDLFPRRGTVIALLDGMDKDKFREVLRIIADPANPAVNPAFEIIPAPRRAAVLAANERLRERLKTASAADPGLPRMLAGLARGNILLLRAGPVAPRVFEALYGASTLAPALEGKNAANLAGLWGIPFLPIFKVSYEDLGLDPALGSVPEKLAYGSAGYDFEAIARFFIEAATPGSALRGLFWDKRIRQDDFDNDKLVAVLRRVRELASGRAQ